jgi:lipoate-protein ligase B
MGARDYVCRIEKIIKSHLKDSHGIQHVPSEHTGVFLDPNTKIASIGVQVRHRLTSHGFAINITNEPLAWFNKVVACGLDDVHAGSVESKNLHPVTLEDEIPGLVAQFGGHFDRNMVKMDLEHEGDIGKAIAELEKEAEAAGHWKTAPTDKS